VERAPELEALTRQLFEMFFATGDASIAERLVSQEDGVLVIGTDPQEWLADYDTIMGTFRAQAQEISALSPDFDLGDVSGTGRVTSGGSRPARPFACPAPER
jgi:hypothetical protein